MVFRTRSTEVEAIQYQVSLGNNRVMNWLAVHHCNVVGWTFNDGVITVPTPAGPIKAVDWDWIVNDKVRGEFHVFKGDEFDQRYEEVKFK